MVRPSVCAQSRRWTRIGAHCRSGSSASVPSAPRASSRAVTRVLAMAARRRTSRREALPSISGRKADSELPSGRVPSRRSGGARCRWGGITRVRRAVAAGDAVPGDGAALCRRLGGFSHVVLRDWPHIPAGSLGHGRGLCGDVGAAVGSGRPRPAARRHPQRASDQRAGATRPRYGLAPMPARRHAPNRPGPTPPAPERAT